jgi:hypothetical protein
MTDETLTRLIQKPGGKAHLPKFGGFQYSQQAACGIAVRPLEQMRIVSDTEVRPDELCRRCFDERGEK